MKNIKFVLTLIITFFFSYGCVDTVLVSNPLPKDNKQYSSISKLVIKGSVSQTESTYRI